MRFFKLSAIVTIIALVLGLNPTFAMKTLVTAELETPGTSRTLLLPIEAGNAHVISLGTAVDPQSGKVVEGYAVFHHKAGHGDGPGGGPGGGTSSCFTFLAKDAKWKNVEPWVVNATNSRALDETFVINNLTSDIDEWEDAADGIVDGSISNDILGDGTATTTILVADSVSPDSQNEVYFADVSTPGAIAVTIVWGIFNGPPSGRVLVEWDQVYDDVDYDWSATGEAGKMDFENIAQHELGHSFGMDHPDSTCTEETMYSTAGIGETKKRDLNSGDITGVEKLYN
jgi:hypothetical protein